MKKPNLILAAMVATARGMLGARVIIDEIRLVRMHDINFVKIFNTPLVSGRLKKLNLILTAMVATAIPVFYSCILVGIVSAYRGDLLI